MHETFSQAEINLIVELETAPMVFIAMKSRAMFELLIRNTASIADALLSRHVIDV